MLGESAALSEQYHSHYGIVVLCFMEWVQDKGHQILMADLLFNASWNVQFLANLEISLFGF